MNESSDNKPKPQEIFYQNLRQLSNKAESQVMIFLLILIIAGMIYNIVSKKEHNFNICPLCEEPTNYKEKDEPRISTYTF